MAETMEALSQAIRKLPRGKLKAIKSDPVKTASLVNLVYVNDNQPGIQRIKKGKGFEYRTGNKKLTDGAVLDRIKSLVLPPAWKNVWICSRANGHLQATGLDARERKQYKYHAHWSALRNQTKFYRLLEFGNALPSIRKQLQKDIELPGLPVEKVLALVVMLMEGTNIRVGNNFYEKLYGSFGLTTLKDRHVSISGNQLKFMFKGKKGIAHDISLKSKKLAALVKKCRDIPGKELFQYYDDSGNRKPIDSGMVNDYIKRISGASFSAKDFRTWSGTVYALQGLKAVNTAAGDAEIKNNIVSVIDTVATHLGNTRAVCRKYYIHPAVITVYEKCLFDKYNGKKTKIKPGGLLNPDEQMLLMILKDH